MDNAYNGEKKQLAASSPAKYSRVLPAALMAVLLLTAFKAGSVKVLRITGQISGKEYFTAPVKTSDVLTYGWVHSLERIPWTEDYIILRSGRILLKKITIPAFGAGIPHNKGKVTKIENGCIIMDEIYEEFERIDWIHSRSALEYIMLNGKIVLHGGDLPHHAPLTLEIEKGLKLWSK
jgi:hypothetical protein